MAIKKSITVFTANFFPEDTAIGLYTTQFCIFLKEKGYSVKIVTGFPSYPQWRIYEAYKNLPDFHTEIYDGMEIIRYKQYVPTNVNLKGRVFMMLSLFYGTLRNLSKIKNTDLVICIVPFTLSVFPALLLSKFKKAKLWVHIQDFEFDLALDSGVLKKSNILFSLFKKMILFFEKKMLTSADVVSSISYSMLKKIKIKTGTVEGYYFPNWVSSEKINPEKSLPHPYISENKFSLLYSGNIGEKQDWLFLKKLCQYIAHNDNFEIIIVGSGGFKNKLAEMLKPFDFVKFHEPVPYQELNDLLCSADIHFLFQKTEVIDTIMPSKILGMMASSKPSIISGNTKSEVSRILNESEGGFYFNNNDEASDVYNTLLKLKKDKALSEKMGSKARNYIVDMFSEKNILEDFNEKIKSILDL